MKWNNALNIASLVALGAAVVFGSPTPAKQVSDSLDHDIQNKVRSGSIAIANRDNPHSSHSKHSSHRNGQSTPPAADTPEGPRRRRRRVSRRDDQLAVHTDVVTKQDGEITYICDGAEIPGGRLCAQIIGWYETEPLAALLLSLDQSADSCADSCASAGFGLGLLDPNDGDQCRCIDTFEQPAQTPSVLDGEGSTVVIFCVDFFCTDIDPPVDVGGSESNAPVKNSTQVTGVGPNGLGFLNQTEIVARPIVIDIPTNAVVEVGIPLNVTVTRVPSA